MKTKSAELKVKSGASSKSVLARQEDGTIQLTITIPQKIVQEKRAEALKVLVQNLDVPGFRKGKAPTDIAMKYIDQQKLNNHMLQLILPDAYALAVEEHKIKPVLAPRFELLSILEGSDWSVRATTCELPEVELGDYKKTLVGILAKKDIWVPGKDGAGKDGKAHASKIPTKEEKEQEVIKALIEKVDVKIPKPLIDEEVNHRLSRLLEQVQKLGLTIEQYLASTGKNSDQLREEYARQAQETIKLELALNKVAQLEKIEVDDKEVEQIIAASTNATESVNGASKQKPSSQQQKQMVRSALVRRKALDSLVALG